MRLVAYDPTHDVHPTIARYHLIVANGDSEQADG
jgi:hypothetical protein